MKTALVTGFSGQDGTFLTRLLLDKGYKVVGLVRRISSEPPYRIRGKFDFSSEIRQRNLVLEEGDLLSPTSLNRIIQTHNPHEIYNLAAQSDVGISFKEPEFTIEVGFMGLVNLITALETCGYDWKLYQAGSSEMFGNKPAGTVLNEKTPLTPNSPYAIAKTAAHHYMRMKRKEGRFCVNGILFNHESEIRGNNFVTQKIAQGVINWRNTYKPIELGNLDSIRDWGYAGDYVKAMWQMLQQDSPSDYVIGTGETHTVRDFVEAAFEVIDIKIRWNQHEGVMEVGYIDNNAAVVINPAFYRPVDVNFLHADRAKAETALGWKPRITFKELVALMVKAQEGKQDD